MSAAAQPTPLEVRTVDPTGRVLLPQEFANATVTVEVVSGSEIRIQRAGGVSESEEPFLEERLTPLSNRDRDFFLELIDNPPPPNAALRAAMEEYRKRHG